MLFLTLPVVVVDVILSYLTLCELLNLRQVCKDMKKIATNEIRKRYKYKTFNLKCCTRNCMLIAKLAVFGCNQINVKYCLICHWTCKNGIARLCPADASNIMNFDNTQSLTIESSKFPSNFLPSPCIFAFSNKFVNLTRLSLFNVKLMMEPFCLALSQQWNKLNTVSLKRCDGLTPQWLLALNKHVISITAKKCLHPKEMSLAVSSAFLPVSAFLVSEKLQSLEYLSIDVQEEFEKFSQFNVSEMVNRARCLREVHLTIYSWCNIRQILYATVLERLRLHILCLPNAHEELQFFDYSNIDHYCESLENVEIKFINCIPTYSFTQKLMYALKSIKSLTLTASYIDHNDSFYEAIAISLRRLEEFLYRKHFLTFMWYNGKWSEALLNFLENGCRAKNVSLYFRRHYFVDFKQPKVLKFLYEVIRIAQLRQNVSYSLTFTNHIGYTVLPQNVQVKIIDKYISVKKIWSMKRNR